MTRAFVAVRPPREVLDAIDRRAARADLPPGGRRTTRDQWHLTLQFLGDVADLGAVAGALAGIEVAPAPVRLSGAGTLPPERRSRYLVLFLRDGAGWVTALAGAVGARLVPLGCEPEARPFTPHLTLARFRRAVDLRAACAAIGAEPVGASWTVTDVVLYESILRSTGAQYVERAVVPLPG